MSSIAKKRERARTLVSPSYTQSVGCISFTQSSSAAKIPLELQIVNIFFDSSTFDKVEKDAKVTLNKNPSIFWKAKKQIKRTYLESTRIPPREERCIVTKSLQNQAHGIGFTESRQTLAAPNS